MVLKTKNLLCLMEVWTSWSRQRRKWVEEIYRVLPDVPLCMTKDECSRVQTKIPIIWNLSYTTLYAITDLRTVWALHIAIAWNVVYEVCVQCFWSHDWWWWLHIWHICTYTPHICSWNIWHICAVWWTYLFFFCTWKARTDEVDVFCCVLGHIWTNVGSICPMEWEQC